MPVIDGRLYAGGGPEADQAREAKRYADYGSGLFCAASDSGALGRGIAQMARAPGKTFSRTEILAIIRAKQAECRSPRRMGPTPDGLLVLAELVDTFENLE